jgi:hypothetical protein
MISRHKILVSAILMLATSVAIAAKKDDSIAVAPQGETELVTKLGSLNVQARIRAHQVETGQKQSTDGNLACTYSRSPCSVVDQLSISVNGKSLFIPKSLFLDVADINRMEAKRRGGDLYLMVHGGDASESYNLKIIFDGERIKQRILASALSPDEILQETTYYRQVLGD